MDAYLAEMLKHAWNTVWDSTSRVVVTSEKGEREGNKVGSVIAVMFDFLR